MDRRIERSSSRRSASAIAAGARGARGARRLRLRPVRPHAHAHGRRGAVTVSKVSYGHVSRVHPGHRQRRAAHDGLPRRRRRRAGHGRARRGGRVRDGRRSARHVQEHELELQVISAEAQVTEQLDQLEHDAAAIRADPSAQPARAHRHRLPDRPAHARPRAQAAAASRPAAPRPGRSTISKRSSSATRACASRLEQQLRLDEEYLHALRVARMATALEAMNKNLAITRQNLTNLVDHRADHGTAHAARGERRRVESRRASASGKSTRSARSK